MIRVGTKINKEMEEINPEIARDFFVFETYKKDGKLVYYEKSIDENKYKNILHCSTIEEMKEKAEYILKAFNEPIIDLDNFPNEYKMRIETQLPMFPGFYDTILSPDEQYAVQVISDDFDYDSYDYDDYEYGYDDYFKDVSLKFIDGVEGLLNELGLDIKIRFIQIVSPAYYNFENDKLKVECEIPYQTLEKLMDYAKTNRKEFSNFLIRNFKSRDGFISFYSHEVDDWFNEYDIEDYIIFYSFLSFFLENQGFDYTYDYYNQFDIGDIMLEVKKK